MDLVLRELAEKETFTKDEFVTSFKRHRPLNMLDPIWSFIIEEEIKKYLDSGALLQSGYDSFTVTEEAKEAIKGESMAQTS